MEQVSDWAFDAYSALYRAGLKLSDKYGYLHPQGYPYRLELADMLMRYFAL